MSRVLPRRTGGGVKILVGVVGGNSFLRVLSYFSAQHYRCRLKQISMSHSETIIPADAIGVVIPVYNRPRLAFDALDSVNRRPRSRPRWSSSMTVRGRIQGLVGEWIANHPELDVELLALHHAGVSNARNAGIATGWVSFLAIPDSDDLWPEDFLERSFERLNRCPEAVASRPIAFISPAIRRAAEQLVRVERGPGLVDDQKRWGTYFLHLISDQSPA